MHEQPRTPARLAGRAGSTFAPAPALACAVLALAASSPVAQDPDLAELAFEAFHAGHLDEAIPRLVELTEANEWHGQAWEALGRALLSTGRPAEAAPAFRRAAEIGVQPALNAYNAACAHARAGDTDAALQRLEDALEHGFHDQDLLFTDPDLDPLRDDERFRALAGVPPEGLSRAGQWEHDLTFLARRIEELHVYPFGRITRAELHDAIEQLQRDAEELSDAQVVLRLQKIVAAIGDGHTRVRDIASEGGQRYPVGYYLYSDGLFVRVELDDGLDVVGGQVLEIGGRPASEVFLAASEYVSHDNEMGLRAWTPFYLAQPVVLRELGLADADGSIALRVRMPGGEEREVRLAPSAPPSFAPRPANLGASSPPPRYLRHGRETFGFEHLPEHELVYVWLNEIADAPNETLEAFTSRLLAFVDENDVDALAVDIRLNGGGNNYLNRPLVRGLSEHPTLGREGHLFVITGRRTFSAAVDLVTALEQETEMLVVGEPCGAGPNVAGEPRTIRLPCSGVLVRCSMHFDQASHPFDHRKYIWPDLPAPLSSADFAANRDPALDAILAYLRAARE